MKFQDDLESGRRERNLSCSAAEQIEKYRAKLVERVSVWASVVGIAGPVCFVIRNRLQTGCPVNVSELISFKIGFG